MTTLMCSRLSAARTLPSWLGRGLSSSAPTTKARNLWAEQDTYKWFLPIQTRVKDNDCYGHVNNAVYAAYFDTVINIYLMRYCGLDMNPATSQLIGIMAHTQCSYLAPAQYPDAFLGGLCVDRIGKSSVSYRTALFGLKNGQNEKKPCLNLWKGHWKTDSVTGLFDNTAVATGHNVHVFVKPSDQSKGVPVPDPMRQNLSDVHIELPSN